MKQMLKAGLTAALVAYGLSSTAQMNTFKGFTKEDLIDDYRLSMEILKKQHPNPYKFIDSASYDRKVDSLLKKMAAQNNPAACSQFSPIGLLRDVHTSSIFFEEYIQEMVSKTNFLPFPVIIERGKILVNSKETQIPFASEIVTINGMTVDEMLAATSINAYSDGYITTGTDRLYADFQIKFSLLYPDRKTFDVSYKAPGTNVAKKVTLPFANSTEVFQSRAKAVLPINLSQPTFLGFKDFHEATQTGILRVNTFAVDEGNAYNEFSNFFKEVNTLKYKNVIIDVRNNLSGNLAIAALLYSFLSPASFKNEYNYRTKSINIAYPEYATLNGAKYSEADVAINENIMYQCFDKDIVTGLYIGNERLKEGQVENFPRDKDAFIGNVYVLTGGGTVSAATYFTSLVQKNKRGVIVGKETGSGEQATMADWFTIYSLPKTKASLKVPMAELYFFNATSDKGRGVVPDKEVPLDKFISYVQASKDPELTYVLEQIAVDKSNNTAK